MHTLIYWDFGDAQCDSVSSTLQQELVDRKFCNGIHKLSGVGLKALSMKIAAITHDGMQGRWQQGPGYEIATPPSRSFPSALCKNTSGNKQRYRHGQKGGGGYLVQVGGLEGQVGLRHLQLQAGPLLPRRPQDGLRFLHLAIARCQAAPQQLHFLAFRVPAPLSRSFLNLQRGMSALISCSTAQPLFLTS